MIYEGAIIRRLVTPNHPGCPSLEDGNAFRTEYVLEDVDFAPARITRTDRIVWTTDFTKAFHYPRHLDAQERGFQISPHCVARVVRKDGDEIGNLSGAVHAATPADRRGAASCRAEAGGPDTPPAQSFFSGGVESRHELNERPRPLRDGSSPALVNSGSGSSAPPAENILPVARQELRSEVGGQQALVRSAAGKSFSKSKRKKALRQAARRTAPAVSDRTWWREGQYA